ncbi:hypothetical protein P308_00985 [Pseudomonas piscis]|nr:hypothetical protein P308_00985 [Pseudomonas piscis]
MEAVGLALALRVMLVHHLEAQGLAGAVASHHRVADGALVRRLDDGLQRVLRVAIAQGDIGLFHHSEYIFVAHPEVFQVGLCKHPQFAGRGVLR